MLKPKLVWLSVNLDKNKLKEKKKTYYAFICGHFFESLAKAVKEGAAKIRLKVCKDCFVYYDLHSYLVS